MATSVAKKLTPEERNAVLWLQRQTGVTNVIPKRKQYTPHRRAIGFTQIVKADASSVLLRTYPGKDYCRDLYVHAPAGPQRDQWLKTVEHTTIVAAPQTTLTHTVPKAESFSADVPAPKPLDKEAGQLFDVTPTLAAKWLERNTRNRPLRDSVVLKYAADMKEGKWKITGDAIAFDSDGAVVNGQHRLWAVLESGATVKMLVVFDLEPDVVYVLDDHFKRRLTDVIHIARPGSTIQTKHAAMARAMMFPINATGTHRAMARMSRQKQVEFMDRHIEAIEFVITDCFRNKNSKGVTNSNILAAVARAYYTQDKERLKQFGQVMATGLSNGQDDQAAIALRNWMLSLESRNVRSKAEVIMAKAERAIYGFLHREHTRGVHEANTELFPLPEELTPDSRVPKIKIKPSGKSPLRGASSQTSRISA